MPAVTQLIPNFLGGVSRQNDDKKLVNQLTECVNGYPDATFGLLKRPGMSFIDKLEEPNGDVLSDLSNAAWFHIDRASAGSYVGCIKGTSIRVWNVETGEACTVTAPGGGAIATGYLTGASQNDYHFRSIQDTTIITNKIFDTAMQPAGSFVAGSVATLKLNSLTAGDEFTVTIDHVDILNHNGLNPIVADTNTTYDDMLYPKASPGNNDFDHYIIDGIINYLRTDPNFQNTGTWYVESYPNSIVIRHTDAVPTLQADSVVTDYSAPTGNPVAFDIDARGGLNNTSLEVFEDDVIDVTKLPLESFGGHVVKILNSNAAEDDYYVKFVAYDTTINRGRGYWEETHARDVSPGLDPNSMPHRLTNTGTNTFTYGPIDWKGRLTGDDTTNPPPSFITVNDTSPVTYTGKRISSTFFYSNRFGVLSEDNVFLSVSNDPYNFFAKSALTQIDSDPIDLNVSSVRPVTLSDVLPSPQGLLLFSERQQFQLYATDASVLTPTSAVIRALSNYEMATNIPPIDIGTSTVFVSRVPGYSKLFNMQLRDVEQSPLVIDISKAVLEWLPDSIDGLTTSPPNSAVILIDRDTKYLYVYRYYNNGQEDLFQSWTKWELPGTVETAKIINDEVYIVTKQGSQYTIGSIALDELPAGSTVSTTSSFNGNPALDMATRPVSFGGVTTLGIGLVGTGYSNDTAVATTTTGTGTGLTVDITVEGPGSVVAATVNTPGQGYNLGDVVTITGGDGTATATVVDRLTDPVVWDETNDITKIYVPYTPIANKEAAMLLTVPTADKGTDSELDSDQGYWAVATERTEIGTGHRYFEVKGNFANYADGIVVGYNYDFEVTLPKFYFRRNETVTDYTATLTINKVQLSAGRTGAIQFKLKPTGSNEWRNIEHTTLADTYQGDTNPVISERLFSIPIHQRNTNFELKVTSNYPYPVSLVSMMWEGNYSPRFYRRA